MTIPHPVDAAKRFPSAEDTVDRRDPADSRASTNVMRESLRPMNWAKRSQSSQRPPRHRPMT